jgi:hypothetical protein
MPLVKRVPIPVVILLSLGAVALPWWLGTRHMDFLKPPTEFQLTRLRSDVVSSFAKRSGSTAEPRSPELERAIQSPIKPAPMIDPGDPHAPAGLDAFREHAGKGVKGFIELAVHLEEQSGNARALLAWERVLDVCQPDPSQRAAAIAGIQRLRPLAAPWHVDPLEEKVLVVETTVPEGLAAEALDDVAGDCAKVLNKHAAGLLRFESRVERPAKKPAPKPPRKPKKPAKPAAEEPAPPPPPPPMFSVQILLEGEKASPAGRVEFPVSDDPQQFRREILAACYKLVSSQLAATTDFTPPEPLGPESDPSAALGTRITRLCWSEFGKTFVPADPP